MSWHGSATGLLTVALLAIVYLVGVIIRNHRDGGSDDQK